MHTLVPSRTVVSEVGALPSSPGDLHLVVHDPSDGTYLVLALAQKALYRVDREGRGHMVKSLVYPEHLQPLYVHTAQLYRDRERGAPVLLVSTYVEAAGDGLLLFAWTGETLAPIATTNGTKVAGSDAFAYDEERAVLVHFTGQRDIHAELDRARRARGGVGVRELGADGAWRDVDALLPGIGAADLFAGYEPRTKRIVLVDADTRRTFGWDGARFEELGALPEAPWKPCTLFPAPSGNLLYLHRQRSSTDLRALLWELDGDGWVPRPIGGLEVFGGGAFDPARGESLVYGPWLGAGTVQHVWGRVERAGLALVRPSPTLSRGSTGGPPTFWGARDPGHGNYAVEVRRPYAAAVVHRPGARDLAPVATTPPALAIVGGKPGVFAIGYRGDVHRLDGSEFETIGAGPDGFVEREDTLAGIDAAGRILLVGGEPSARGRRLMDTWLYDGAWRELTPKGAAPIEEGAFVARDEGRGVWIVCGGTVRFEASKKVHELGEKKWASYPAVVVGGGAPGIVSFVGWDPESAQTIAVASDDYGDTHVLYALRPRGVFDPIARIEGRLGVLAYDGATRTLAGTTTEPSWVDGRFAFRTTTATLDLAEALDRAVPSRAFSEPPASLSLPDRVWLELRQHDRRSYWFSTRKGKNVTVRHGRRGTDGITETTTHGSVAAARGAHERATADKLAEGYEHSPEGEGCATIPGKKAFYVKLGTKGEDLFGGLAPGFSKDRWPSCRNCDAPMTHVLTLNAHHDRLPLRDHAALSMFVCGNEETAGDCEVWDPDEGANAIVLSTADELARPTLRAAPKGPDGDSPSPTLRQKKIAYRDGFEEDPEANDNPDPIRAETKVGGYPGWIQFPDTPSCSVCDREMRFVAQVGELAEEVNFAGGDAYVFCCPEEHEARMLCQR